MACLDVILPVPNVHYHVMLGANLKNNITIILSIWFFITLASLKYFPRGVRVSVGIFVIQISVFFNTMAGHNVNVSIVRYTQDTAIAIVQIRHNEK